MNEIMLIIFGVLLIVIGAFNFTGHIETIHSYNRKNITEETRKPYGKAVGLGTGIIGFSLIVTAVLNMVFENELVYIATVTGVVIGLGLILYGQFKYNKGLF